MASELPESRFELQSANGNIPFQVESANIVRQRLPRQIRAAMERKCSAITHLVRYPLRLIREAVPFTYRLCMGVYFNAELLFQNCPGLG
jgi:hypothetical protein